MIDAIKLENWRSHDETRLTFRSGVNGLVGDMGAGKSSILEALTYGLYGTLPAVKSQRITLDDLIRRHPTAYDEAQVAVEFTIDESSYRVERTLKRSDGTDKSMLRKNGSLIAGPQTQEVTEAITDILGIGFELFTTIVYAEQNQMDFFLDLAPSDRREMIDELLHLDRFEDARGNLVTLRNTIKQEYSAKEDQLQDEQEAFDEEELKTLSDKIEQLEETIDEMTETIATKHEQQADLEEQVEDLEDRKEKHAHLKEQIDKLSGTQSSLEDDISQLQDALPDERLGLDEATITDRLEAIKDKYDTWESLQETKQEKEKKQASLQQKKDGLQEDLEELNEQKEKLEDLADVEEQLEDLNDKRTDTADTYQSINASIDQLTEQRESLQSADSTCPVCERELDDEHRNQLLEETNDQLDTKNDTMEELEERIDELDEKIETVSSQRDALLQYQGVDEKIAETSEDVDEVTEKVKTVDDDRAQLEDTMDDLDPETLRDERDQLQQAQQLQNKQAKKERIEEKINDLQEQQEDLSFDEESFEETHEHLNELTSQIDVLQSKIESKNNLIDEKEERLDTYKEQQEHIKELEETLEALSEQRDFLSELEHALEQTQEQMRKEFVSTTNDVMDQVWNTVYPYHDYPSIRLNAGEDYRLVLEDQRGEMIPVEGEVSGGERHTAAFTLRIALATVLTPDTRLLILDEPTHNLDRQAIEQLGETLRHTIDGFMDQVFLITHDEQLESAVTGDLYRLQNDESTNGITTVDAPYQ